MITSLNDYLQCENNDNIIDIRSRCNGIQRHCANTYYGEKITEIEKDCWSIEYDAFEKYVDSLSPNEKIKLKVQLLANC